jgi:hypothetical protein
MTLASISAAAAARSFAPTAPVAARAQPGIECKLISHAATDHLQQVYTGFRLLHQRGLIRLSQHCTRDGVAVSSDQHLRDSSGGHLRVIVNGRIRVHYDCHDSFEIHEKNLEQCDFYFKRSFLRSYVDGFQAHAGKIFPLGLHYSVLPDSPDPYAVRRALALGKGLNAKLASLIDALGGANPLRYAARMRDLESLPNYDLPARVLFLVTAYDPYSRRDRSKAKIEEYIRINETRARCIQVLRKELGPNFLGGFTHNAYTVKNYREFLVADHGVTVKKRYLETLKSYPICIATTGLHGSIGWKFAEYVALSKAIVSEKLNYEVTGDLREGRNYLEFGTPEQCAERCTRLMEHRATRNALMLNNALYYQSYLRPDALVSNSLLKALAQAYECDFSAHLSLR